MTKDELTSTFNSKFTEFDSTGNRIVKGTPSEIVDWMDEQFQNSGGPLFLKADTGMTDKRGRPIHEGDSVRIYHKGEYVVYKVIYDPRHAAFFIRWPD